MKQKMLKKAIALLAVLTMCLITVMSPVVVQAAPVGDVSGDGAVNASDLANLKKLLAALIPEDDSSVVNADVDKSGSVNAGDLATLKKILAGIIIPEEETDSAIKVAKVEAKAGQTVTVPVEIVGNPGIAGAVITLTYDKKLTLSEAASGEAFSSLQFSPAGKFESPCNFVWDSETGETKEDGVILNLTFVVPSDAKAGDVYNISCSYNEGDIFNDNWDDVVLQTIAGTITIK